MAIFHQGEARSLVAEIGNLKRRLVNTVRESRCQMIGGAFFARRGIGYLGGISFRVGGCGVDSGGSGAIRATQ